MYRYELVSGKKPLLWLLMIIAFLGAMQCFALEKQRTGTASLSIRVRHGWVDVYVSNEGPGDLDATYRPDISYLGSNVQFFFYTKKGICKSCKFSPQDDLLYIIPIATRHGVIFPTEIAGVSFPVSEVADRYSLKSGECYALFAMFIQHGKKGSTSRHVSNVDRVCVR
jgi:hypothetical protein